jgi:hypothetical protein
VRSSVSGWEIFDAYSRHHYVVTSAGSIYQVDGNCRVDYLKPVSLWLDGTRNLPTKRAMLMEVANWKAQMH